MNLHCNLFTHSYQHQHPVINGYLKTLFGELRLAATVFGFRIRSTFTLTIFPHVNVQCCCQRFFYRANLLLTEREVKTEELLITPQKTKRQKQKTNKMNIFFHQSDSTTTTQINKGFLGRFLTLNSKFYNRIWSNTPIIKWFWFKRQCAICALNNDGRFKLEDCLCHTWLSLTFFTSQV